MKLDPKYFWPHFKRLNQVLNHRDNQDKHRPALKVMIEQFKLNFPDHTPLHRTLDLVYSKKCLR